MDILTEGFHHINNPFGDVYSHLVGRSIVLSDPILMFFIQYSDELLYMCSNLSNINYPGCYDKFLFNIMQRQLHYDAM